MEVFSLSGRLEVMIGCYSMLIPFIGSVPIFLMAAVIKEVWFE